MSWLAILILILLLGLIIGGLYISRMATVKQMEAQELKARLRQRRARLSEVEELFSTLMIYDRNPELLGALKDRLVQEAEVMVDMAPKDPACQRDLEYYQGLANDIDQLGDLQNQPETPTSDRQINIIKRHFGRTMKLIRNVMNRGEMNELSGHEHLARLKRNTLMLEVEAYKLQGQRAKENQDTSTAAAYFKHAKDMLIASDIPFDGKSKQIKTISRMITGLYSSEFDPEDDKEASDNDNQSASDKA
ncbi:hypothetical protein [Saccharospirillum salsuginis]|uniref:Uncharacterized protein n=1 Tax=Saccharospirillum salsuginis TaxID=418750 RepID=A0A918K7I2_9GAMM|nr:hypothetical protein [Saccharospirillum salsuginis]GGX53451.1 hypothetical protein GCM10007392_21200 [Saccharospirillum salsuginis]